MKMPIIPIMRDTTKTVTLFLTLIVTGIVIILTASTVRRVASILTASAKANSVTNVLIPSTVITVHFFRIAKIAQTVIF